MLCAADALARLKEGNSRFTSGVSQIDATATAARRSELTSGQKPFAVILGCSDSRVPAELVFDQGLGELFVVRVAGNIVAPSQLGSIEFAVDQFATRLVVVMGHSHCGAIGATLAALKKPSHNISPSLKSIVENIEPAVKPLLETELRESPEKLMEQAIRAHVRASVEQLRNGSQVLTELIDGSGLQIVGAEYCLETGVVHFFDEIRGENPRVPPCSAV